MPYYTGLTIMIIGLTAYQEPKAHLHAFTLLKMHTVAASLTNPTINQSLSGFFKTFVVAP